MRTILTLAILLGSALVAAAQSTAVQLTTQRDSIPTTTIVPLVQPAVVVRDTITQPSLPPARNHRERRAERAEQYAFRIDSLVASRSFAFYPTAMQAVPDGEIRLVYADYFYIYLSPVDLEVHLPLERGAMRQVSIINFDSDRIEGYNAAKFQSQWNISFTARDDGHSYNFMMLISTITGQTELTIEGTDGAMRYIGSVGQRIREKM